MTAKRSRTAFRDRFNVWPGFTDIMVGLLLVFVFVVTLFTLTQTILSQSLNEKDTELERLEKQLSLKQNELDRLSEEISKLTKLFEAQLEKTSGLEQLLAARTRELEAASLELKSKSDVLEEKDKLLVTARKDLDSALEQIKEKSVILNQREQQLAAYKSEIDAALTKIQESTRILGEREKQVSDLELRLKDASESLTTTKAELLDRTKTIADLRSRIDLLNHHISSLNEKIAGYVVEVERLNKLVADAKQVEAAEKTKASNLQKEIVSLRSKLDEISNKLAAAEATTQQEFRLAQLVNLIGEKDKEIDRLRKLARYRSEFFAKLEQVFSGINDIKVQGDRFIFQAEILFASGRTEINESGKQELDKFVRIYKEMVPKIPKDVNLIILVQGHTDIDPVRTSRFKSNWELSSARALQVVHYLIEKGIPPEMVGASALGEFHPVDKDTTPEAKRLNRRIEIKITSL